MEAKPTTGREASALYHYDNGKPVLPKVSDLRRRLAEKAKRETKFRFYALYDRIYRKDVKRQSQRPFKLPEGTSWYQVVYKTLGVYQLK